jgi:hypothetical protein
MNRFALFAAAMLVLVPCVADAGCGDGLCDVGAAGTGGESSGGAAQGSLTRHPSFFFDGVFTTSGTNTAGHINVTGGAGSLSGAFAGGNFNGHATGFLGDFSGQCSVEDFEAGECE